MDRPIITEQEIKARVESNPTVFPFTEDESAYIQKIPYEDWDDIDLALKVNNMIHNEFFA